MEGSFCKIVRPSADRHASFLSREARREQQKKVGFNQHDEQQSDADPAIQGVPHGAHGNTQQRNCLPSIQWNALRQIAGFRY